MISSGNKDMLLEYINVGFDIECLLYQYCRDFEIKNLHLLYLLLEKGARLNNDQLYTIISKMVDENLTEELKKLLFDLKIDLNNFESKYVETIIKKVLESGSLEMNKFFHSLLNYKNYIYINSGNENIISLVTSKLFGSDLKYSIKIFDTISRNKHVNNIIP